VGDRVTLLEPAERLVQVDLKGTLKRKVGKLVFKMGECYSVNWIEPKMYAGGYSYVSEKCLILLLKRNDPRWVEKPKTNAVESTHVIHTQESSTMVEETPSA
jgi:hypothetical protein